MPVLNMKMQCPVCGETDSNLHQLSASGDKILIISVIVIDGTTIYLRICLSCGYDGSNGIPNTATNGDWIRLTS